MHIRLELDETDLKELFSLFTCSTTYEVAQVYEEGGIHWFQHENLNDEYHLTLPKRDFALDAWHGVILFLRRHGAQIVLNGQMVDLSFIEKELIPDG